VRSASSTSDGGAARGAEPGTAAARSNGRSRRRLGALVLSCAAAVALGVWLWRAGDDATLWHELLLPVEGALVAAALWRTWKWARPRARGDRRASDRRVQARRTIEVSGPSV
jgi:hypothetical protein